MTRLAKDLLATGLLAALTAFFLVMAGPIMIRALRAGRLLARGVIYDRHANPRMYGGGIAFWAGLASLPAIMTMVGVARVISP